MIATLNAPKDDRFHVISGHSRDALLIDPIRPILSILESSEARTR